MEEVDSAQFAEWQAFMSADPFLHERMDLLFASLFAFLESRFCGDSSSSITLSDYLYSPWGKENWEKPPAKEKVAAMLKSIFSAMPGVVVKEAERAHE